MTSGKQSLNNPKSLQGYVEQEEKEAFKKIASRDAKTPSELLRIAVLEYNKHHSSGNLQYILDDFDKNNPDMIAIPALMKNREALSKYVQEEKDKAELEKVLDQCEFLTGLIRSKLLTQANNDPEGFRIEQKRKNRLRLANDIRFKDPSKLSDTEKMSWNTIRSQYTDEEWEKLQERFRKENEEINKAS
jgi:hypothetical protein